MKKITAIIFGLSLVLLFLNVSANKAAAVQYSCPLTATDNGDGTCSIFLINVDDDTITLHSGGGGPLMEVTLQVDNPESVQNQEVKSPVPTADTYSRAGASSFGAGNAWGLFGDTFTSIGYAEWDTSSLPVDWTISGVILHYNGIQSFGNNLITEIVGVTLRPSTVADPDLINLFNNINLSAAKYVTPWAPEAGPDKIVILEGTAVPDLRSALPNGWFAIGLNVVQPGDGMNNANLIYSLTYEDPVPPPTLEVLYTAQTVPELQNTGSSPFILVLNGFLLLIGVSLLTSKISPQRLFTLVNPYRSIDTPSNSH